MSNTSDLYIVHLPAIPGPDMRHTSLKSATRELRNATKAGLGTNAWINRVTIRRAA